MVILLIAWWLAAAILVGIDLRARVAGEPRGRASLGIWVFAVVLMIVAVAHMSLSTRWSLYPSQVGGPLDSPAHTGDYIVDVLQSLKVSDVLGDSMGAPTCVGGPSLYYGAVSLRFREKDFSHDDDIVGQPRHQPVLEAGEAPVEGFPVGTRGRGASGSSGAGRAAARTP